MTQIMDGGTVGVFVVMFGVTYAAMKLLPKKSLGGQKYPPSMRTVPILGSIPFIPSYEKMHSEFMNITEQLGNVFSFYLGNKFTIVLHGFDAMQEAFSKRSTDFASRPNLYVTHELLNPTWKGIIDRPYDAGFKKNHQQALTILKNFGFGQTIMEDRIHMEVEELVELFRQHGDKSLCPLDLITSNVLNVIASIMFGARFNRHDPSFDGLVSAVHCFVKYSIDLAPLMMFPSLRVLPSTKRNMKRVTDAQDQIFSIIKEKVALGMESGSGASFAASFIEAGGEDYDKEELKYTMRDLLLAGTETSATTLQWALILMANHPDIQKRIQHDIDAVVPRDRLPSLADKTNLPYVEAAIHEIMRRWTIVPMGAPHESLCDTEVGGYFVPKGTTVFANIYSCHMDPKVWPNPEEFRPERFLDSDNKLILRDRMVAFSMGKRSCLGEMLARQEIYLFFAGLLQNFDILPEEGQDKVDFVVGKGGTIGPDKYKLRLVPRSTA